MARGLQCASLFATLMSSIYSLLTYVFFLSSDPVQTLCKFHVEEVHSGEGKGVRCCTGIILLLLLVGLSFWFVF